jgi:hypothetical protein
LFGPSLPFLAGGSERLTNRRDAAHVAKIPGPEIFLIRNLRGLRDWIMLIPETWCARVGPLRLMIRAQTRRPAYAMWVYDTSLRRNVFRKTVKGPLDQVKLELLAASRLFFEGDNQGIVWREFGCRFADPRLPGLASETQPQRKLNFPLA